MRFFTAALVTETNTFSPLPTGWPAFRANGICWGEEDYREETAFTECVLHVRSLAERDGHQVILGPSAYADPAGPAERDVYERLRDEILQLIRTRGPFDALILTLHGAMVAAGYDDCEGDLLRRARRLVGPDVFIGVMLDPHCHLTATMVMAADVILAMKEYPHTDGKQRLEELYRLALEKDTLRPASVLVDCNMVGVWPTREQPIRSLVDSISSRESRYPMLHITFAHGFPWGDVPDAGARLLVTCDGDLDFATAQAMEVADDIWALRDHARNRTVTVDDALTAVAANQGGLLVLADIADNPGGGAPGDSTFILRAALDRRLSGIAAAILHDPQALQQCREAGAGSRVSLRLGGRHGAVSGPPLEVEAMIRQLSDCHSQQAAGGGARIPLGPCAWIEACGIHIIISASRYQAVSPDVFTGLGLSLDSIGAVVLKSTHHFRAQFATIARKTLSVDTPGALSVDFANIPYRRRSGLFWPRLQERLPPRIILRKPREPRSPCAAPPEPA